MYNESQTGSQSQIIGILSSGNSGIVVIFSNAEEYVFIERQVGILYNRLAFHFTGHILYAFVRGIFTGNISGICYFF